MDLKYYHPSSLPRIVKCPPSAAHVDGEGGPTRINKSSQPARLGTALHEAMAFYERHGVARNMDEVAAKHEVPEDELIELFAVAKRGWLAVEALFPQPLIEVRMKQQILDGVFLVGTADLLDTSDPDHIQLLDWKTGWKQADYWHQLLAYAYMALRLYGNEDSTVTARIAWLRSREISEHTFTAE